ncbi:MAG: hypothetical protein RL734_285 [Bacteroidota bacterium]|jgi:hypothetical protein
MKCRIMLSDLTSRSQISTTALRMKPRKTDRMLCNQLISQCTVASALIYSEVHNIRILDIPME